MTERHSHKPSSEVINWQNFDRHLTPDERNDIKSILAGYHFSQETLPHNPTTLQLLNAAEALQREIDMSNRDDQLLSRITTE